MRAVGHSRAFHHRGNRALRLRVIDNSHASPTGKTRLFFVHGSMAHHKQFEAQLNHFHEHPHIQRVVGYDLYGCGDSAKPDEWSAYAEHEMLEDLRSVVRTHHGDVNVLVAHSFGTNLSLQLAALDPGLVHGLVLLGPAASQPLRPLFRAMMYLPIPLLKQLSRTMSRGFVSAAFHPETPQSVLQASARHNSTNPWHVTRSFYRQMKWRAAEVLARGAAAVPQPTLLIAGAADQLTPPAAAAAVAAALPHARLKILEKSGHMMMMEQPAEVNRLIEEHVRIVEELVHARRHAQATTSTTAAAQSS